MTAAKKTAKKPLKPGLIRAKPVHFVIDVTLETDKQDGDQYPVPRNIPEVMHPGDTVTYVSPDGQVTVEFEKDQEDRGPGSHLTLRRCNRRSPDGRRWGSAKYCERRHLLWQVFHHETFVPTETPGDALRNKGSMKNRHRSREEDIQSKSVQSKAVQSPAAITS